MRDSFWLIVAGALFLPSCLSTTQTEPSEVPRSGDYKTSVRAWMGPHEAVGQGAPATTGWSRYEFVRTDGTERAVVAELGRGFETLCKDQGGSPALSSDYKLKEELHTCVREGREVFGMSVRLGAPRSEFVWFGKNKDGSRGLAGGERIQPIVVEHFDERQIREPSRRAAAREAAKQAERDRLRANHEAYGRYMQKFRSELTPGALVKVSTLVNPGPGGPPGPGNLRPAFREGTVVEVKPELVLIQFPDALEWIRTGEVLPP